MIVLPMAAALLLAHFAGRSGPVATSVTAAGSRSDESLAHLSTSALAHFLLQLLVVLLVAKAAGWLLRRFGQPAVVGEMAAGLLLGPLLLGSLMPGLQGWLFAPDSLGALGLISQLGVLMFLFVAGAELNLGGLRGRRRFTLLVSHTGIALPFLLGVVLAWGLYPQHAPAAIGFASFALFMGISLSVTAFPVLLRILADRGLSATPLGQVATASAAVGDATAWCLLALIVSGVQAQSWEAASVNVLAVLVFAGLVLGLLRPWVSRQIIAPKHQARWLIALLLLALACALVTEVLGIHALFGAFAAGVAVSGNDDLRRLLSEKVEPFAIALLLPLFFAMTGLRMHADAVQAADLWLCVLIIAVATAGKLFGTWGAARSVGMANLEAWKLGALMNTRGLMELIVLNLGYELGLIGDRLFAVLVIMALVTTAMTGPLLGLIDRVAARDPSLR
jgi:Kef-type K+ transport system membrane component KefB